MADVDYGIYFKSERQDFLHLVINPCNYNTVFHD